MCMEIQSKKSHRVPLMLSPEEHETTVKYANELGMNVSVFIRYLINQYGKETGLDATGSKRTGRGE